MASTKKKTAAPFTWARNVASSEGSPFVVAGAATFAKREGNVEGAGEYVDIDEGAVLLDSEGGGAADVGYTDDEVIVLLTTSDFDDEPKKLAKLTKAIEAGKHPEYLVGTIELAGELVVDDAANAERPGFTLPRKAGQYTVSEGHFDEDGEARWCRLSPHGAKKYAKRPKEAPVDPVQRELARISFDSPKEEAWALEAGLRLIDLGRPDLTIDLCAKASPARRALASWTRVLALAAQRNEAAASEGATLAEEWLRPADSVEHASQALPRAHILRALDAAAADATLRARVAAAPEPDVFVPDGGDDFF